MLAGEQTIEQIMLNQVEWYAENGITLHLDKTITKIDRVKRMVIAADGTTAPYDRLLLATGSNPFILPVPGKELKGVLSYRDIADTHGMIDAAAIYKHAVVIGGGLLGLEAANGLMLRGMDVTVVHIMPWLMERQLDKVAAKMLQKSLEDRGLRFMLEAQTAELLGNAEGRVKAVKFKDGSEVPADLVVMAVGIRPNTTLAQTAGLRCSERPGGILVNDTMQTYDPRIYAVGECVNHRGAAYGLVAPLFEMAKVCANHLAQFGIGIYAGSVTSTKLKVTGIDLFSAGDFRGDAEVNDAREEITLSDPIGGVYKKLVIRDDKLIGACLYGDTVDGSWYFSLLREGKPIGEIRDHLMFGEDHLGDTGHAGVSKAVSMADDAEVCGCNGVSKGVVCKAIKEKGLFTLEDVRKHTKASSSCGSCTGLVEQLLMFVAGGDYSAAPTAKVMCGCTDKTHQDARDAIRKEHLTSIPEAMAFLKWRTPNGCSSCRPALNYYMISTWPNEAKDDPQSRFINERAHANIQKDGTYSVIPRMWGGETNASELRRIADVVDKYKIPTVKVTGGSTHRSARGEEGRPQERMDRPRHAERPRLREGAAHREDLRRQRVVPLRHAELHAAGSATRTRSLADVFAAQGQAGGVGMPPQLRRGRHQGRRRDRRRLGLGDVRRWQRGHQDRGRALLRQAEDARGSSRARRCLPAALSRGRLVSRANGPLRHAGRARALQEAGARRRGQSARALRTPAVRDDGRGRRVAPARAGAGRRASVPARRFLVSTATMEQWIDICAVTDVPVLGARVVERKAGANIAIFRNADDRVFALLDVCPHKGGPLSQGIVFGERVACPLHNWSIGLVDGVAALPDEGCTKAYTVKVDGGRIHLDGNEVYAKALGGDGTSAPDVPTNALAA